MRSQPGDDATTRRLALYLVALAAIARETEEREINPGGIVLRYWDNTFHSSLARSKPDWRPDQRVKEYDPQDEPPEGTCLAREMVTNDLQLLASASKLSAADIDSLIAAFADQSLGGIKYLEEFRDAIAGAPGRP